MLRLLDVDPDIYVPANWSGLQCAISFTECSHLHACCRACVSTERHTAGHTLPSGFEQEETPWPGHECLHICAAHSPCRELADFALPYLQRRVDICFQTAETGCNVASCGTERTGDMVVGISAACVFKEDI